MKLAHLADFLNLGGAYSHRVDHVDRPFLHQYHQGKVVIVDQAKTHYPVVFIHVWEQTMFMFRQSRGGVIGYLSVRQGGSAQVAILVFLGAKVDKAGGDNEIVSDARFLGDYVSSG